MYRHTQESVEVLDGHPWIARRPPIIRNGETSMGSGKAPTTIILPLKSGVSDWTIHDLRRTFATIATGELSIDPVVMDKILNHRSGVVKGVAAVYQRHAYLDQRKSAMRKWSEYLVGLTAHSTSEE